MTKAERDHVIDQCIERVLSLRESCAPFQRKAVIPVTGAACFQLLQLKSEPIECALKEASGQLAQVERA